MNGTAVKVVVVLVSAWVLYYVLKFTCSLSCWPIKRRCWDCLTRKRGCHRYQRRVLRRGERYYYLCEECASERGYIETERLKWWES